jgi:hypothetical protein
MTNTSSNGEVFGAGALYAVMVAAAVAVLLGSIWSPTTVAAPAASVAAPQMVVSAAPQGHVS